MFSLPWVVASFSSATDFLFLLLGSLTSFDLVNRVLPKTIGQHSERLSYAGKSLIVHNTLARITNVCFAYASYVIAPSSHSCFNSSIKGSKYTSISIPGAYFPGINNDKIM